MDPNIAPTENIVKREDDVLYLQSKLAGYEAVLALTSSKLKLVADDSGALNRGLYQFLPFLKDKPQKTKVVFDLDTASIKNVVQGKQGFNNNVLEITDVQNNQYRIVVKSYEQWAELLKSK